MIRRAKLQVKPVLSGKANQPSGATNAVTTNIPKTIVTFNPPAAGEPSDGVPATRDDAPVLSDVRGVVTVPPVTREDDAPVVQTSGDIVPLARDAVPGDGSPVCRDGVPVTGDVAPATKDNKQVDEDRAETGREKSDEENKLQKNQKIDAPVSNTTLPKQRRPTIKPAVKIHVKPNSAVDSTKTLENGNSTDNPVEEISKSLKSTDASKQQSVPVIEPKPLASSQSQGTDVCITAVGQARRSKIKPKPIVDKVDKVATSTKQETSIFNELSEYFANDKVTDGIANIINFADDVILVDDKEGLVDSSANATSAASNETVQCSSESDLQFLKDASSIFGDSVTVVSASSNSSNAIQVSSNSSKAEVDEVVTLDNVDDDPDVPCSSSKSVAKQVSTKIPHRFTKMKPSFWTESLKQKSSTSITSTASSSVVTDELVVPLSINKQEVVGMSDTGDEIKEKEVPRDGSLFDNAQKTAAKLIARKIKKKIRTVENLNEPIDKSKICMRDLIYMNPTNNPMTVPKKSSANVQPALPNKTLPDVVEVALNNNVALSSDDDSDDMAPQVKIGPDGEIILNVASLVIEDKTVNKPMEMEVVDETDLIRRGYPKKNRTRSWTVKETQRFYAALSMIGTDFSLMNRLFKKRDRADLKRKFKREEKMHRYLVEAALKDRRCLDISLLAEPSSDEETTDAKNDKSRTGSEPKKRGRQKKKEVEVEKVAEVKVAAVIGKENQHQNGVPVRGRKRKEETAGGKKAKKSRSHYYEESNSDDEADKIAAMMNDEEQQHQDTDQKLANGQQQASGQQKARGQQQASGQQQATGQQPASDQQRDGTESVGSPVNSSEEDEVEFVRSICKRTRSGRLPKPRSFEAPVVSNKNSSPPKLCPSLKSNQSSSSTLVPSNVSSSLQSNSMPRLKSPPHCTSHPSIPQQAPTDLHHPDSCHEPSSLPDAGFMSDFVSGNKFADGDNFTQCFLPTSSQMPALQQQLGIQNLPPGQQLLVVASPVGAGEGMVPGQQLLHVFMVSTEEAAAAGNIVDNPSGFLQSLRHTSLSTKEEPVMTQIWPVEKNETTANISTAGKDNKDVVVPCPSSFTNSVATNSLNITAILEDPKFEQESVEKQLTTYVEESCFSRHFDPSESAPPCISDDEDGLDSIANFIQQDDGTIVIVADSYGGTSMLQ